MAAESTTALQPGHNTHNQLPPRVQNNAKSSIHSFRIQHIIFYCVFSRQRSRQAYSIAYTNSINRPVCKHSLTLHLHPPLYTSFSLLLLHQHYGPFFYTHSRALLHPLNNATRTLYQSSTMTTHMHMHPVLTRYTKHVTKQNTATTSSPTLYLYLHTQ